MTRQRIRRLTLMLVAAGMLACSLGAVRAGAAGPIVWDPAGSTYGDGGTPFVLVPSPPAPAGTGATADGSAFGSGFWDAANAVFSFGFLNAPHMSPDTPTMPETELADTALPAGTRVVLKFNKAAGQRINFIAILGDPDLGVSLSPIGTALTTATSFTVTARVAAPVASAGGDVQAAMGLLVDCSTSTARNYQGSLFLTDMHWLDVGPPSISASTMAGLNANGRNGVAATFDGMFTRDFLTSMGISDPTTVYGYIDTTKILPGSTNATFTVKGLGNGSLWPSDYFKYRITNSGWSAHNVLYGRAVTRPKRVTAKSPKGLISAPKPTFRWRAVVGAAKYEVRVYRGSKLLFKRPNLRKTSWKCTKKLPRKLALKWKVRASNSAGAGTWSKTLKFRIR